MPRRKPEIPDIERPICARVREARQKLGYSQREFAEQVGISRASLASYEESRVALRLYVAMRICRQFIIGEKWLATGDGDWRGLLDLRYEPELLELQLSPLMPYGEAFSKHLAPIFAEVKEETNVPFRVVLSDSEAPAFLNNLFAFSVSRWCEDLQPRDAVDLVRQLLLVGERLVGFLRATGSVPVFTERVWRELCPQYAEAYAQLNPRGARLGIPTPHASDGSRSALSQQNSLTGNPVSETVPCVKTAIDSWPSLRAQLRALTMVRGAKVVLARRFNVTPQAVSDWLREVYSPEADTALKLLRFVESGEAAQLLTSASAKAEPGAQPKAALAPTTKARKKK